MRKIFWALFVVGCSFNVHGVESTVKTSIVRPNSVKDAQLMFIEASVRGCEKLIDQLLVQARDNPHVTQNGVQEAFRLAAERGHINIMKKLLDFKDGRWLTERDVGNAFYTASCDESVEVMEWLLNKVTDERKVTAQTVKDALEWAVGNGYVGEVKRKTVNYLVNQRRIHIDQKVLQDAFEGTRVRLGLQSFAEIHFPKKMYESSEALSERLDGKIFADWELDRIMAKKTKDGQISPFAQYLIESVLDDKKWVSKKPWFPKETAKQLLLDQYYQDAMALIKMRKQGTTAVSKLPSGVSMCVLEYTHPNITGAGDGHGNQKESNEQGQAKKGGQKNDGDSID